MVIPHRAIVVGASLAGLRAAQALRDEGFEGSITLVGDEPHAPYDRPPLSKQFLTGRVGAEDLALPEPVNLDASFRLGRPATGLDLEHREVVLDGGETIPWDLLVIATGASAVVPRMWGLGSAGAGTTGVPRPHHRALPEGLHVLRSRDDAERLATSLESGPLVVIGAGFIGLEVAASARSLGVEVTVVEAAESPLIRALDPEIGAAIGTLHTDNGVRLLTSTPVLGVLGETRVEGIRVEGTRVEDGWGEGIRVGSSRGEDSRVEDGRFEDSRVGDGVIRAANVLVAVGARPNTVWLEDSGVELSDGVLTDQHLRVMSDGKPLADVVAVGDVARRRLPPSRPGVSQDAPAEYIRDEHWTAAGESAAYAARTLLHGPGDGYDNPGYVWSDQYKSKLQIIGRIGPEDSRVAIDGDLSQPRWAFAFGQGDRLTAVVGCSRPAKVMRLLNQLGQPGSFPPA